MRVVVLSTSAVAILLMVTVMVIALAGDLSEGVILVLSGMFGTTLMSIANALHSETRHSRTVRKLDDIEKEIDK